MDDYHNSFGFDMVLTYLFIILKFTGLIDWSWWWVFSPVIITTIIYVIIIIIISILRGK